MEVKLSSYPRFVLRFLAGQGCESLSVLICLFESSPFQAWKGELVYSVKMKFSYSFVIRNGVAEG